MPAITIVGAQWGDEGKGKIVDLFAESADVVVRFAGGPNAGHTLVADGNKFIVRLLPSGILHSGTECIMAQGMVVDPFVLVSEIEALTARGISMTGRLFLSDRSHLVLPYHILMDELRESRAAPGQKIGTTKRGIGPCYEDKAARRGVLAAELLDLPSLRKHIAQAISDWSPAITALGGLAPHVNEIMDKIEPIAATLRPLLCDTSLRVDQALRRGARVLLEGAQGTLLDLDHGTYPFVTSSSAVAGGACTGSGIGPTRIEKSIGISKAYATRVGSGPFPTELEDEDGERLRTGGAEFGSVTGRPRRTGWLDLPALRYAIRVNGFDALALTKLDVLSGFRELKVCVAYETQSGRTENPSPGAFATAKPIYETLHGWSSDISTARSLSALPQEARDYVAFVQDALQIPIEMISVGPGRHENVIQKKPFG